MGLYKKDRVLFIILIITLILAVYIRFVNYSDVGYWTDDQATVPAGILWFYPHDFFPGLASSPEPPVGDFLIGLGCMLSGEDFSRVSGIKPEFFPSRAYLIGNELSRANPYCRLTVHVFGLLFLVLVSVLSFMLLGRRGALFSIAFFSFSQWYLMYSRWIKVDIIVTTFTMLAMILLWKAYSSEKGSKKEFRFSMLAFAVMGLNLATKFSAGLMLIFAVFVILEKYKTDFVNILKKIWGIRVENVSYQLVRLFIPLLAVYILVFMLPHKFRLSNVLSVLKLYNTFYSHLGTVRFSIYGVKEIFGMFLQSINILDMAVFLFAIYVFLALIVRKEKKPNERFILYYAVFFILGMLFFPALGLIRASLPYLVSVPLLMALGFSGESYSIIRRFKSGKNAVFFTFIIAYIALSFSLAYANSPYHNSARNNYIFCLFRNDICSYDNTFFFSAKATADLYRELLDDNETFLPTGGAINFHIRNEDHLQYYLFFEDFKRQTGREPTLEDMVRYYHPSGRFVRYYHIFPGQPVSDRDELFDTLYLGYTPNYKVELNGREVVVVYDLLNLTKQS